jgi:hypothetical protein
MRVYVDGRLVHTSSTWEVLYYWRYRADNTLPRHQAMNSMLFRLSKYMPVKPTAGGGLYIEEVRFLSLVLAQGRMCVVLAVLMEEERAPSHTAMRLQNNNRCWSRTRPAGRAQQALAGRFARRAQSATHRLAARARSAQNAQGAATRRQPAQVHARRAPTARTSSLRTASTSTAVSSDCGVIAGGRVFFCNSKIVLFFM